MSASSPKSFAVWIVLALVIVGLMGFGATSFSGSSRDMGRAGDKPITMQAYATALSQRLMAERAADGTPMTIAQAEARGVTEQVLARLVATKVLDNDTARMGVSVGDAAIGTEIFATPAFAGADGQFSREAYAYQLERTGQTEASFEADLRDEMARTLLQTGIVTGVPAPQQMIDAVLRSSAETRVVTWAELSPESLSAAPLPAPTETDLRAFYDTNATRYMTAETRRFSAAVLTPAMVQDDLPVDEAALRALYDERADDYIRPERRLVERLVFGDQQQADAARAQLDSGEADFAALVAARGLDLSDIDLGDVTEADLGAAGARVFAAAEGDVIGPVNTALGPALYRVNGLFPAEEVSFEVARADLRAELSADAARRLIGQRRDGIEDLLAGGARLEDLTERTEMQLQDFEWTGSGDDGGLAAYASITDAIPGIAEGDLPALITLEDGGLAALRLDGITPAEPIPFAQAEAQLRRDWQQMAETAALAALGAEMADQLRAGASFADLGLTGVVLDPLRRSDVIAAAPDGFITVAFDTAEGAVAQVSAGGREALLRVDAVTAGDPADPDLAPARDRLGLILSQALADDMLGAYASAAQMQTEITLDRTAQAAVHARFR